MTAKRGTLGGMINESRSHPLTNNNSIDITIRAELLSTKAELNGSARRIYLIYNIIK